MNRDMSGVVNSEGKLTLANDQCHARSVHEYVPRLVPQCSVWSDGGLTAQYYGLFTMTELMLRHCKWHINDPLLPSTLEHGTNG